MPSSEFGRQLRFWRQRRGLSQLELSARAGTTPRHLSFLETGRSRPGRAMVLRLAGELELPLRERNELLAAAGLPTAFPALSMDEPALAPIRAAIVALLDGHDPLPAALLDRYGAVLKANAAFERLSPGLVGVPPEELVDRMFGPGQWRAMVENWEEVAAAWFSRQRAEIRRTGDQRLEQLVARAERLAAPLPPPAAPAELPVICSRLRHGDEVLELFTAVVRFDQAAEVTASELRVELIYPANEAAARFFRGSDTPA